MKMTITKNIGGMLQTLRWPDGQSRKTTIQLGKF